MKKKNFELKKSFFFLVLAFFVAFFSFSIYTVLSGIISFADPDGWDGVTVANSFTSGNGTEENPYVIHNAEEFMYFKSLIEGDTYSSYQDKYYVLDSNINFGGYDITPVGIQVDEEERIFKGKLDGKGFSLTNFKIKDASLFGEVSYYALFSKIEEGEIYRLNLTHYEIDSQESNDVVISGLVGDIHTGVIENVTLSDFYMNTHNNENAVVGLIAGKSLEASFNKVYLAGEVNGNNNGFIHYYESGESSLILSKMKYNGTLEDDNVSDLYIIQNESILLNDEEVSSVSLLTLLNDGLDSSYYWVFENGSLQFSTHELDVVEVPEESKEFKFSIQNASSISVHDKGTEGTSVYVNDLVSDYNYYMGLNYTQIQDANGAIPNGTNQNIYSNSNLATVYIRYTSQDINDPNTYGSVSLSENYTDFYYYKRYPVVNGYVEFDLIDNPWARRPNNRAFNGWVTDDDTAVISLNMDTYVRSVRIPVSDVSQPISITFYSSWTDATTVTTTGTLGNLKNVGMTALSSTYEDVSIYYVSGSVSYNNYYPNNNSLYDMDGNKIEAGSLCEESGGCTYLIKNSSSTYSNSVVYYTVTDNGEDVPATVAITTPKKYPISYYNTDNGSAAGYFKRVTSGTENIYSSTGVKMDACNGTCYQLLQHSDGAMDPNTTYYYLTTRDTNIFAPSGNVSTNNISTARPMTITALNNGVDNSNTRTITLNNNWTMSSDVRVEFIRFYVDEYETENVDNFDSSTYSYKIIGNFKNLKLGRGLKRYTYGNTGYLTATSFVGGSNNSSASMDYYTLIVESGFYQNGSGVGFKGTYDSTPTHHVNASVTLGSDFDRITENNDSLIVYYSYAGSWSSYLYSTSSSSNTYEIPAIVTTVKSGSFGTNKVDYATGIYVGGRGNGTHYALRSIIVEGGYIYNLIGGPASDTNRASKNDVIINVKGGNIDMVFGGAGASDTRGNRILNITGGTINYGVLGGSNAYINPGYGTTDPYGKVNGDTLVYVGGNVEVGTHEGDTLFNVSSGDVFGAGNGRQGELDVGSVNNSNVIIGPSATIHGNVYGGGNFGAVGGNMTGTSTYDGNPGSSTTDDESGLYTDNTIDANIRYYGANPDNYIRFNGDLYRIVGLFNNVPTSDGNKSLVRIVRNTRSSNSTAWLSNNAYISDGGNRVYTNAFVRNDAAETKSNMYNYLNTTFYNSLNATYRNDIQSVEWGLGAITAVNNTSAAFYSAERGTTAGSPQSVTSYDFNVGLLYPSDFGYATNDTACLGVNLNAYAGTCASENWIADIITANAWTMTPSTYSENIYQRTGRTYDSYHIFYLGNSNNLYRTGIGYYNSGYVTRSYAVYPSFYLKDTLTISGGTGTQSDPFIIGDGDLLTDIIIDLATPDPVEVDDYVAVEDDGIYQEASDYQARTHVHVLGGTIDHSVFGAGNNNGAGNMNGTRVALSKITIDVDGGSIGESIYGGSNEQGTVYGDVLLNINNGSIADSVYGGGKGGYSASSDGTYVSRDVDVNIGNDSTSNLTIGRNVYGGSAFGSVNGIEQGEGANDDHVRVTVNAGVITGSVFGGGEGDASYEPSEFGNVYVHINGGSMTKVFGGNDSRGEPSGVDIVYLNGGTIGDAFGGGNNTGQTYSDIRLQGSTITGNIYGGSNEDGYLASSHVTVSSGSVTEVYGGNNLGGTAGKADVKVTGGTVSTAVYGGGKQADATTTNVIIDGCSVPDVYGGGKQAGVDSTTTVTINNATAANVFGGSNTSGDVSVSNIHTTGSTITSLYGGNNSGGETETTNVLLESSTITNVFGGGDNASSTTSNVTVESGTITNLFGGGNEAGVDTTNVRINGGTITNTYGGSNTQGDVDNTNIVINGGNITTLFGGNNLGGEVNSTNISSTGGSVGTLYGGGNQASVGETELTLDSLTAGTIYGGGNEAPVNGDVTAHVTNSTLSEHLYGGGNAAGVTGSVSLSVDNSTITGNVYGGGNEGIVQHDTDVYISNSTILSNVFAGGNGASAVVQDNSTITIDGTSVVGSSSSVAPNSGCVFGSGNAASTGENGSSSLATVNIVGGEIFGNVYGGPKMAVVYGATETNIGTSAVNKPGLTESDIIIHGTVFGGGESNASGSSTYDYTFISVTEGIDVNIDGTGYEQNSHEFIINGSIFGSGNASTSAGESNINIKNLGSMSKPNRAISIQRANKLVIDSSAIELMGTTDRTNELSDFIYSLNLIDLMICKNNTTLFLQHNANLLREYYSGVDVNGTLVKATVDIDDDTKTVTKNVDNRIYMVPGENLHVAVNAAATAYGKVNGMTFFGMYTSGDSNNYRLGLYDPSYTYGDSGNASLELVGGSYVIGLKLDNHDITKDGFYTNILDEESYSSIVTQYINPTPIGKTGYRWTVGFEAISYTVHLQISKYSSLGTAELSMIDFADGNSIFTVLGFDSTGLNDGIQLVDSNDVPRIAATEEEANSILGLSMKIETQEWTSSGTTKFLSQNNGKFTGGEEYTTDSRKVAPSAMFYAYHAKNYSAPNGSLGEAIITLQVAVPKNQIEYNIKFVTITVELESRNPPEGNHYDASITYDKKYELPAATDVYITNKSQFTTYFSLTEFYDKFDTIYGKDNDHYHVVTFTRPLPVGTIITMLDIGARSDRPEYYYYKITQSVYDASVIEVNNKGEASYRLSNFIKMDSTSTNNTYDDATANLLYYDNDTNMVDEEFIFIIDMKDANETGEHLNNKASFELRNADDWPVVNVVAARDALMNYNTFDSSNVVLSQSFENVDQYLYYNVADEFKYSTEILYNQTENRQSIIDTNYEYSSMGLNIVVYDRTGEPVSSSLLLGSSVFVGNNEYFADGGGVIRIKLANKVSTIEKNMKLVIGRNLPAGNYTIRYTLFASEDGLHNSTYQNSVSQEFNVVVVSSSNYITVDCDDETKLVYGETGLNHNGTNINSYLVQYVSELNNPNFRVEIYKRSTDDINSTTYQSVPFNSLFTNNLSSIGSSNEVALPITEEGEQSFDFVLSDNLTSGTYRVVFKLYDNNQLIDEDTKNVIVQKKID